MLRRDYFAKLSRHIEGRGELPHELARRISIDTTGTRWTLFAQMDCGHLVQAGEESWTTVQRQLAQADEMLAVWNHHLSWRWDERELLDTADGPHFRYVRLFVRVKRRDDAGVLRGRVGTMDLVPLLEPPPAPVHSCQTPAQHAALDRLRRRGANDLDIGTRRAGWLQFLADAPEWRLVGT